MLKQINKTSARHVNYETNIKRIQKSFQLKLQGISDHYRRIIMEQEVLAEDLNIQIDQFKAKEIVYQEIQKNCKKELNITEYEFK